MEAAALAKYFSDWIFSPAPRGNAAIDLRYGRFSAVAKAKGPFGAAFFANFLFGRNCQAIRHFRAIS